MADDAANIEFNKYSGISLKENLPVTADVNVMMENEIIRTSSCVGIFFINFNFFMSWAMRIVAATLPANVLRDV